MARREPGDEPALNMPRATETLDYITPPLFRPLSGRLKTGALTTWDTDWRSAFSCATGYAVLTFAYIRSPKHTTHLRVSASRLGPRCAKRQWRCSSAVQGGQRPSAGADDGKPRGKRSFWRPWKAEHSAVLCVPTRVWELPETTVSRAWTQQGEADTWLQTCGCARRSNVAHVATGPRACLGSSGSVSCLRWQPVRLMRFHVSRQPSATGQFPHKFQRLEIQCLRVFQTSLGEAWSWMPWGQNLLSRVSGT